MNLRLKQIYVDIIKLIFKESGNMNEFTANNINAGVADFVDKKVLEEMTKCALALNKPEYSLIYEKYDRYKWASILSNDKSKRIFDEWLGKALNDPYRKCVNVIIVKTQSFLMSEMVDAGMEF